MIFIMGCLLCWLCVHRQAQTCIYHWTNLNQPIPLHHSSLIWSVGLVPVVPSAATSFTSLAFFWRCSTASMNSFRVSYTSTRLTSFSVKRIGCKCILQFYGAIIIQGRQGESKMGKEGSPVDMTNVCNTQGNIVRPRGLVNTLCCENNRLLCKHTCRPLLHIL